MCASKSQDNIRVPERSREISLRVKRCFILGETFCWRCFLKTAFVSVDISLPNKITSFFMSCVSSLYYTWGLIQISCLVFVSSFPHTGGGRSKLHILICLLSFSSSHARTVPNSSTVSLLISQDWHSDPGCLVQRDLSVVHARLDEFLVVLLSK